MEEDHLAKKNSSGFFAFLLVTIAFIYLIVSFSLTIHDEPVEEVIELKYSKKGLYLFPRYEVIASNSERPSTVTKEQFESISIGDTISGYKKNPETFVTEKDIQFEISLGIVILIFLSFLLFALGAITLKDTKFFKKSTKRKKNLKTFTMVIIYGLAIIYLTVGMIFTLLTATNVFHKVSKLNQTEVDGVVAGRDLNIYSGFRGETHRIYELFIHYVDNEGTNHITKKAVSGSTYNKYDYDETIPLAYRNNNEYDVFINTKDLNEIYPAFLSTFFIFIVIYWISVYFIVKGWRKIKKRNKKSREQE